MDTPKSRILIIDDDDASAAKLQDMLATYPDLRVIGRASTLVQGRQMLADFIPDVLFLDIELPDGNGLDLLSEITAKHIDVYVVMFTGFYKDYSQKAFSGCEADYLLKPINEFELDKAVQRYRRSLTESREAATAIPATNDTRGGGFIVTTYTNEMRILRPEDIGYFRYSTSRKLWEVALSGHTFVQLKKGTSASDILAYNPQFVQTHQSFVVNMSYLTLIGSDSCTLYPPFNDDEVAVGRRYVKELKARFTLI